MKKPSRAKTKAWAIRVGDFIYCRPYFMDNRIFDTRKEAEDYKKSEASFADITYWHVVRIGEL